jgi:hypothetical protein
MRRENSSGVDDGAGLDARYVRGSVHFHPLDWNARDRFRLAHDRATEDQPEDEREEEVGDGAGAEDLQPVLAACGTQFGFVRLDEGTDRDDEEEKPHGLDAQVVHPGEDAVAELVDDDGEDERDDAEPNGNDRVDARNSEDQRGAGGEFGRHLREEPELNDEQEAHEDHDGPGEVHAEARRYVKRGARFGKPVKEPAPALGLDHEGRPEEAHAKLLHPSRSEQDEQQ